MIPLKKDEIRFIVDKGFDNFLMLYPEFSNVKNSNVFLFALKKAFQAGWNWSNIQLDFTVQGKPEMHDIRESKFKKITNNLQCRGKGANDEKTEKQD